MKSSAPIIGITDCDKWSAYKGWVESFNHKVEIIRLKAGESTLNQALQCAGIILTGGEDVHPRNYGKPQYIEQYKLRDLNPVRDDFEFSILQQAVASKTPILGICRGLQIANVFFGGTLLPDLPSAGKTGHAIAGDKSDAVHSVTIVKDSNLRAITGKGKTEINSHHHQAADIIGKGLRVTAQASDGTVEGLETENSAGGPCIILVQWHPERMLQSNPMAGKVGGAFLNVAEAYGNGRRK